MKKTVWMLMAFVMLTTVFSACKKKNTEINYQNQLNSVHNINLLQHTIAEFSTTFVKALDDSLLLNTNNSLIEGCYVRLNTLGNKDTLFMDYGTGSFVHDRRMEGIIIVEIEGGLNEIGSMATFNFKSLKYDLLPLPDSTGLNIISSGSFKLSLNSRTQNTVNFSEDFVDFMTTDSLNRNWAAMTGQSTYTYIKYGNSNYYSQDDTIKITMDATYIDYNNRQLTNTSIIPSQLGKNCSYLMLGTTQIDITAPTVESGILIFNDTPKVCMSRFKYEMNDKPFEFEQEWLVK